MTQGIPSTPGIKGWGSLPHANPPNMAVPLSAKFNEADLNDFPNVTAELHTVQRSPCMGTDNAVGYQSMSTLKTTHSRLCEGTEFAIYISPNKAHLFLDILYQVIL